MKGKIKILLMSMLLAVSYSKVGAESIEQKEEIINDLDMKAVERFTNDFFQKNMEKYHVPGAAIAFVKGDQIAFEKGYGYADVENKIKVDPQKTVFGVGSVSKLFTTTAALQAYEEGKIDLDQDVDQYLASFQIHKQYDEPITMAHLLTHTAGFIQSSIGIGTRKESEVKPLDEYLKEGMPQQYYRPGTFFSYSNQGMSLAGYIVERCMNKPFAAYVKERIFEPLEMKSSSFERILPDEIASCKVVGYQYWTQKHSLFRTEGLYYHAVPATCCYGTVDDMAKFVIANLNEGRYKDQALLKPETMENMRLCLAFQLALSSF